MLGSMIVRVPLRDETAARLRELAAAERRTPRQQAAHLIERALSSVDPAERELAAARSSR